MGDAPRLLTSTEAADRIGVSPSTVKRWADEGKLPYETTAGGHRRFSADSLYLFRIGQTGEARKHDVPDEWLRVLLPRADAFAAKGLLYSQRSQGGSWVAVIDNVASAAREIGRLWAQGELDVYEERQASGVLFALLDDVVQSMRAAVGSPTAILAVPNGDHHTLGLKMAELVLREAGWDTIWIGDLIGSDQLEVAVRRRGLDAVVIAATDGAAFTEPPSTYVERLERVCADLGVDLILGGSYDWAANRLGRRIRSFPGLADWAEHARNAHRTVGRRASR